MKHRTPIALLGAGKLGETLIRGLIDAGAVGAARVTVTAGAPRARPNARATSSASAPRPSNRDAVARRRTRDPAERQAAAGRAGARRDCAARSRADQLLISVAASVSTAFIETQPRRGRCRWCARCRTPPALIRRGDDRRSRRGSARHAPSTSSAARGDLRRGRPRRGGRREAHGRDHRPVGQRPRVHLHRDRVAGRGRRQGRPAARARDRAGGADRARRRARWCSRPAQHPALLKDSVTTPAG